MNRADLIERVAAKARIPVAKAEMVLDSVLASMEKAMREGDYVEIRGFGRFDVRSYGAHTGRNPMTGDTIDVKAKRLPRFKVGKELASRVTAGLDRSSAVEPQSPLER
jgi:nucleoid DNA-binding protein